MKSFFTNWDIDLAWYRKIEERGSGISSVSLGLIQFVRTPLSTTKRCKKEKCVTVK